MNYTQVIQGKFVKRLNRFAAEVEIDGEQELVHVKNTGRLAELLVPGAEVFMEISSNPARKYKHSLIAARKNGTIVNIDSQAPNTVLYEALISGKVIELGGLQILKREVTYGNSRFDFYFEREEHKGFIEVKGVTLAKGCTAMFPDAPTTRGTKHVLELMEAVKDGYEGIVFFLVQMKGCSRFMPHAEMDNSFADALKKAVEGGVRVLVYDARVTKTSIEIGEQLTADIG